MMSVVGALFWGWVFYGLQDTLTVLVEGEDFAAHYVLESGWGLLFLALVGAPLVGFAVRPSASVLLAEVAAVGVALLVAAALAGSVPHALPGLGVLVTAALVAALARVGRPRRLRVDTALAVLAAVAALPAASYALRMATATENPEETWGLDHYPVQAAVGVSVMLVAVIGTAVARRPGGRLLVATLVVTTAWLGIESVAYPERVGSFGTFWGWLAVVWSLAYAAAAALAGE